MAQLVNATTYSDARGNLTVIEKIVPFDIKRVFYISGATSPRGNHSNKKTHTALVCVAGTCQVTVYNKNKQIDIFDLDAPEKVLVLRPEEYRIMHNFSPDAVLLVMASEYFDKDDYIEEIPL